MFKHTFCRITPCYKLPLLPHIEGQFEADWAMASMMGFHRVAAQGANCSFCLSGLLAAPPLLYSDAPLPLPAAGFVVQNVDALGQFFAVEPQVLVAVGRGR